MSISRIVVNESQSYLQLCNQYFLWTSCINMISSTLSESKYRYRSLTRAIIFLKLLWVSVWFFPFFFSYFLKGVQSPDIKYVYSVLHYHKHFLSSFMFAGKKYLQNSSLSLSFFRLGSNQLLEALCS